MLQVIPKQTLLDVINTGVEQELTMVEQCYPPPPAKIRLPDENIMDYAQALYDNWDA
jgi:hypothetical protein